MADFGNTFERLERKYLITGDVADQIRAYVEPFCSPDRFNPSHGGYAIYSLYLDTPAYEFHEAWRRGDADRLKLRVRTYGRTGPAFLGVKRKTGDIISKTRVAIARESVAEAVAGFGVPLKPSAEAQHHLDAFAYWTSRTGAEPAVLVAYTREAFVSTIDNYARLTFDRDIRVQAVTDWHLLGLADEPWVTVDDAALYDDLQSPTVLELKCESMMPDWMAHLVRRLELKYRGFSKYGHGIDIMRSAARGLDVSQLWGLYA